MSRENEVVSAYRELYEQFGVDPRSLGWDKGKQDLRFANLTQDWELGGRSILDVGCGFGDFVSYLDSIDISNFNYFGIDIVEEFVEQARVKHRDDNCRFENVSLGEASFSEKYDYSLASGTFNHRIPGVNQYEYLEEAMRTMSSVTTAGFAIDLLSDKVDYAYEHNFNYNPGRVVEIAYQFTRRVIMRNDRFPFEFSIHCFVDDSFAPETTIFNAF